MHTLPSKKSSGLTSFPFRLCSPASPQCHRSHCRLSSTSCSWQSSARRFALADGSEAQTTFPTHFDHIMHGGSSRMRRTERRRMAVANRWRFDLGQFTLCIARRLDRTVESGRCGRRSLRAVELTLQREKIHTFFFFFLFFFFCTSLTTVAAIVFADIVDLAMLDNFTAMPNRLFAHHSRHGQLYGVRLSTRR